MRKKAASGYASLCTYGLPPPILAFHNASHDEKKNKKKVNITQWCVIRNGPFSLSLVTVGMFCLFFI